MQSNISSYLHKDINSDPLIRAQYSPYAMQQTRNIIKNGIDDEAVRRTYVEGISIDGIESKDLDDAIWAEKFSNGYRVFVHISDVTEAVKIYSPLDLEAIKRTTSIYRPDKVLNMYPNELSQGLLSLDENGEKLTLSMAIDLDFEGNILNYNVFESKFKNLKRYDYDSFFDDFCNPESEFHNNLQLMYEIARVRRNYRKVSGANLDYDESDRRNYIGEKQQKPNIIHKGISKHLIEEFMILANICAARLTFENKIDSVYRVHQNEFERAFYSLDREHHTGLALRDYTHFTSPIRRYGDDIVHRVLKLVHLRNLPNPYKKGEINDIAKHINSSREIIDIIGWSIVGESKYSDEINKLKETGTKITTSTFTKQIRGGHKSKISSKKLPKVIKNEIINDIKNGLIGEWAWCIGVFLISKEEDIKVVLYKRLLQDFAISSKAVLNILNETRIFDDMENKNLFKVEHVESPNTYQIKFSFKGEEIFNIQSSFKSNNGESSKGNLRKKAVKKIFSHFLNLKEHNLK